MKKYPNAVIVQLSQRFEVGPGFLAQCLEESVIEVREVQGTWDLDGGTLLHLRRLQRICDTFDVEPAAAKLILDLTERIADLEEEIRMLRHNA
jgi:hypothetical protein